MTDGDLRAVKGFIKLHMGMDHKKIPIFFVYIDRNINFS